MPLDLIPDKELTLIPDDDIGAENTKDLLGKIYAGASLPIRGAMSMGIAPAAGIAGLAELATGSDLKDVSEGIQKRIGFPFEKLQTESSKKATEKLGELMYEQPKQITGDIGVSDLPPLADINKPMDMSQLLNEAKARSLYEGGFDALVFGSMFKGGRGKGPRVSEAELQAGREALKTKQPPQPVEQPPLLLEDKTIHPDSLREIMSQEGIPPEVPVRPTELNFPPIEGLETPVPPLKGTVERPPVAEPTYRPPLETEANYERLSQPDTTQPPKTTGIVTAPSPAMEMQRIRQMEENTRTNEMRANFPSQDIPLRVETQESPMTRALVGEKKYEGGAIFESGKEQTTYPIQKTGELPQPSGNAFSEFSRAKMPTEAPSWDPQRRAFIGDLPTFGGVGKKQGGAVDPDVFLKSIFKGKEIPIEARERIGTRQLEGAQLDVDHLLRETIRAKKDGNESQLKVLVPELNSAREALKRAQIYMDHVKSITSRPKAPVLGMTQFGKKERGSIDFGSDDFKRFKDNLPEPLRGKAKAIYKALMAEQEARATTTPQTTDIAQREAIGKVPGLKFALERIEPIEGLAPEEIIQRSLSEPDLNFKIMGSGSFPKWLSNPLGRGITPGGLMTGWAKKNTVVQYIAQEVNRAKIRANIIKHERLLDEKTGLKSLINKLDTPERAGKLLIEMEGKPGELDMSTLNPREVTVVKRLREVADQFLEDMNAVRKELGFTKPIEKRDNWLPGSFVGDFQINVFRKHVREDGTSFNEMIGRYGRNTRWAADNARSKLVDKYADDPKVFVEEVRHRPMSRLELRESNRVFSALEDMVGKDDPLFQTIQELKDQMMEAGPYEYLGVRKHFMPKKKVGVSGAKGFDDLIGMKQNSHDMFENTLQYFEQAAEWIEMQRASLKIKDIIGSSELRSQRPELMKYIDLYWRTVSKQGTNFSRAVDHISSFMADVTGIGETPFRDGTRMVKSGLTLSYLTTTVFMGVQIMQPVQMMPTWMAYMSMKGARGNPALSVALASSDMSMLMHKQFMTEFGRDAIKWAEDNQALTPHMLDDIRPETMERALGGARDLAGLPLRVVEEYTRKYAYLGYSHFLRLSGMEVGPHMYETALNLTNMAMTDYRLHERPLIYQQLGVIGEAMSTLTAFKHNNYGQLLGFVEHSKEGPRLFDGKTGKQIKDHSTRNAAGAALLATVGGIMLFSGLSGMHFREDVDNIITGLNQYVLPHLPGLPKPIPTTMDYMLRNLPDTITFGGMSNITGMDLSSRFSQAKALPEMGAGTVFPYTRDVGRRLGSLGSMISNPSMTTATQALYQNAPNIVKGPMENLIQGSDRLAPNVMNPEKGGFERNSQDKMARYLGGRSLREAKSQIATRQFELGEQFRETMKTKILEQAKEAPWRRKELAKKYVQLSPDNPDKAAMKFAQEIQAYIEGPKTTPLEKIGKQAPNSPARAGRRYNYGNE